MMTHEARVAAVMERGRGQGTAEEAAAHGRGPWSWPPWPPGFALGSDGITTEKEAD